jgi:NAD(P)-dependent dehydrogenase (short-subunit alcohol dehydrogenase family)
MVIDPEEVVDGGSMDGQEPCGAALVTGGGRRIGRAIVERLAQETWAVAVHASPRSRAEAEAFVDQLCAEGAQACVVCADLADVDATEGLVAEAARVLGPIDLLVNNASVFERDDARAFAPAVLERHLAVNLRAPVQLAARFYASLPSDWEGAIVNVVDQRVLRPSADFFSYTLSKSALWTATQTMALAFAPRVRVNAVGPGPTLPNAVDGPESFAREVAGAPLSRPVSPQSIAEAVLFLAGARSVTGQMIAVDAGQHLGSPRLV